MTDPCIISSYSLSQKEQLLKNKLYSAQKPLKATEPPAQTSAPPPISETPYRKTTMAMTTEPVTDKNLNNFINEVRAEFQKTQMATGGAGMAQNMLYHKAKMLESHIGVLEKNQQNMTELFKTIVQGGGAGGKNDKMKYEICNENRRILAETLGPLHKQIEEIKKLYEENKNSTNELQDNMQTIKEIIKTRPSDIDADIDKKYKALKAGNTKLQGAINNAYGEMDKFSTLGLNSEVFKNEVVKIKEQMQEIQKDSQAVELEMQRRFMRILEENEKCKLMLATGITNIPKAANEIAGPSQSVAKLEPFDYDNFTDTISDITAEVNNIEKRFKNGTVNYPVITQNTNKGKIAPPFYDFSIEPISLKPTSDTTLPKLNEKPAYLSNIKTRVVQVQPPARFEQPKPMTNIPSSIVDQVIIPPPKPEKVKPAPKQALAQKEKPRKSIGDEQNYPKYERKEPPREQLRELSLKRPETEQVPVFTKNMPTKIEMKEYIDSELKKQVEELVMPIKDRLAKQQPVEESKKPEQKMDITPKVTSINIEPAEPNFNKNMAEKPPAQIPSYISQKAKPAPQTLKGKVEDVLADMLFNDLKSEKQVVREPIKKQESIQYEPDFEPENEPKDKILKQPIEQPKKVEQAPVEEKKIISPLLKETKEIGISAIIQQPPTIVQSKEPEFKPQPPGANTFVYVKRDVKCEVQQISPEAISILPDQNQKKVESIKPQPVEEIKQPINIEHIKMDNEAEILKRKIPINVEPLIAGMLIPPTNYSNPFSINTGPGVATGYAGLQIPPPHTVNLDEYEISSASGIQDSSVNSERSGVLHSTVRGPPKITVESEMDSVSEGEIRTRNLKGLSRPNIPPNATASQEHSNVISIASSPSQLSAGEIRTKALPVKKPYVFSQEDFTYSEGENVIQENSSSNFQDQSEENLSAVNSLEDLGAIQKIREIKKQQDIMKQSQESFGLRSSMKNEGGLRKSEDKVNIAFSGEDAEPEEGEVKMNPFNLKQ